VPRIDIDSSASDDLGCLGNSRDINANIPEPAHQSVQRS